MNNSFPFDDPSTIHITMPHQPDAPAPPGVRVHVRGDLDPERDITVVDGIPCTTVERTIVDLAEEWDLHDVVDVIDTAARTGQLDVAKLEDTIRRKQHERATRIASTALGLWRSGVNVGL